MKLPFRKRKDWDKRWLVLPSWRVLHRIAEPEVDAWAEDYEGLWGVIEGRAVCGATGKFAMPGVFSRMGLRRCAHCCDRLGIPRGNGAPFNENVDEPGCEGPLPPPEADR